MMRRSFRRNKTMKRWSSSTNCSTSTKKSRITRTKQRPKTQATQKSLLKKCSNVNALRANKEGRAAYILSVRREWGIKIEIEMIGEIGIETEGETGMTEMTMTVIAEGGVAGGRERKEIAPERKGCVGRENGSNRAEGSVVRKNTTKTMMAKSQTALTNRLPPLLPPLSRPLLKTKVASNHHNRNRNNRKGPFLQVHLNLQLRNPNPNNPVK
mmetsp:Transcript_29029/g.51023  ORF Transcript_29029/g.51023 Transcript_29029/m.51023 type:complete len:212 (+) Transcript_29029:438-1073(+)